MPADLAEKTDRYEGLLADALSAAEAVPPSETPLGDLADAYREMAAAYLEDGRHFREQGDLVNALASFAYGHAWLDAGARAGLFEVPDASERFTV